MIFFLQCFNESLVHRSTQWDDTGCKSSTPPSPLFSFLQLNQRVLCQCQELFSFPSFFSDSKILFTKVSKPISTRFFSIYKICFHNYTKLEVLFERHFWEHKVLEFSNKINFSSWLPEALQKARIQLFFASCGARGCFFFVGSHSIWQMH